MCSRANNFCFDLWVSRQLTCNPSLSIFRCDQAGQHHCRGRGQNWRRLYRGGHRSGIIQMEILECITYYRETWPRSSPSSARGPEAEHFSEELTAYAVTVWNLYSTSVFEITYRYGSTVIVKCKIHEDAFSSFLSCGQQTFLNFEILFRIFHICNFSSLKSRICRRFILTRISFVSVLKYLKTLLPVYKSQNLSPK